MYRQSKIIMDENTVIAEQQGAFLTSLKRNYKQIRDDRASAIVEKTQLKYKRQIEDLVLKISDMKREQDNMLDLSPTTTQSLVMASDFKEDEYIAKDLSLGVAIRNEEIRLEIAKKRYEHLFGKL